MIWFWLALAGVAVLCFLFPVVRCILLHPFKVVYYAVKDLIFWFYHKEYNRCEAGFIDCYCGLFGQGKTLSAVRRVVRDYKRYNGRLTWIKATGKFEPVKVNILSNVDLQGVPYTHLDSMQQIVDWTAYAPAHPNEWCLVVIDEASAILNSRDFKNNLDFFSINALVTCRHFNLGLILTSQRFLLIDKLCREVCQQVIQCHKYWRIIVHNVYDAFDLENTTNPLTVKPLKRSAIFCSDRVFGNYNTMAVVGAIKKACKDGAMRSEAEIREAIAATSCPEDIPDTRRSRSYIKSKKKAA